MMQNTQALALTIAARDTESALILEYEIQNKSAEQAFFVFVLATDPDTEPRPHDADCIINDSELMVSLTQAPLPEEIRVPVKVLPLSVKLLPGETYRDFIRLAFPIQEKHAYSLDGSSLAETRLPVRQITKLGFRTEYFRPEDAFFVREIDGLDNIYRTNGHPKHQLQASLDAPKPLAVRPSSHPLFQKY